MNAPWTIPQIEAAPWAGHVSSPVDLEGDDGRDAMGWTTRVVVTATLFLLLSNAGALRSWASELPPGAATEPLVAAADRWHAATHALALDAPVETMRSWWQAAQAARLPDGEDQR